MIIRLNILVCVLMVAGIGHKVKADDDGDSNGCQRTHIGNDIPMDLSVHADECLKEHAVGTGVQIYSCTGGAWVLKAPEANLTISNRFVGNHFLGPKWEWKDGSKISGIKVAQVSSPDPKSIPWLLLATTTTDDSFRGKLSDVLHVQRVHTVGGVAPALPCTEGAEARVSYQADYLFYHLNQ